MQVQAPLPHPLGTRATAATRFSRAAKELAHEHVHERAAVVTKLLLPESDPKAILRASQACVVTRAEHKQLTAAKDVEGGRDTLQWDCIPLT